MTLLVRLSPSIGVKTFCLRIKRSFEITIHPDTLIQFIDRYIGWKDLSDGLRFVFDFRSSNDCYLEVAMFGGEPSFREVGKWRDC